MQFESAVSHLDAEKVDPQITLIQSDTAGIVPCGRDTLDISSKESNCICRILMRRALCDSPRLDLVSLPLLNALNSFPYVTNFDFLSN